MHPELVGADLTLAAGAVLFAGTKKHADTETTRSRRTPLTILVVDNDPVLRMLIGRFLTLCGYRVLDARLGSEALALVRQHPEPVDLLLTDVVMPGMNGFEVAEALTRLHPEAKVLFMSGHVVDFPDVRGAFEAHPSMFMVKPFWSEALLEKIQSILPDPGPCGV